MIRLSRYTKPFRFLLEKNLVMTDWAALSQYNHYQAYRDSEVQGTDIYANDGGERRLYEATLLMEGKEPKEIFPHWALWVDPSQADESQHDADQSQGLHRSERPAIYYWRQNSG